MRVVVRFGVGHGSWSCTDRARRRDRHFGPLRGGVQKFCPHFWTFEESRGGTRPACYRRANRTSDAQGAASRVLVHPRSRTRRAGPFSCTVTWFTWGGCPLARRVLRLRRSIRASELGPGRLPGTGERPRHEQQAWSLRRVNVSPKHCCYVTPSPPPLPAICRCISASDQMMDGWRSFRGPTPDM